MIVEDMVVVVVVVREFKSGFLLRLVVTDEVNV